MSASHMSLDASREGCKLIAANIEQLTHNATHLLEFNEDIVDRRVAWILTVHAIDEGGKLIKMMRESVNAESLGLDKVTVSGLRDHSSKGSEAGHAGLQALDMFERVVVRMARDLDMEGFDIQRYRGHLEAIRANFTRERSRALYAVFADDRWLSPSCANEDDIYFDAWILSLMAVIVRINLEAEKSFLEVDGIVRKIMNSSKLLSEEWKKEV